jgi:hypothetical protein
MIRLPWRKLDDRFFVVDGDNEYILWFNERSEVWMLTSGGGNRILSGDCSPFEAIDLAESIILCK